MASPEQYRGRYLDTLRGLPEPGPELAARVEQWGEVLVPLSGRVNESPEDHAIIFWGMIIHIRASAAFRGWWASSKSGLPKGHLKHLRLIMGARTPFSDKQISQIVRILRRWVKAFMSGEFVYVAMN